MLILNSYPNFSQVSVQNILIKLVSILVVLKFKFKEWIFFLILT